MADTTSTSTWDSSSSATATSPTKAASSLKDRVGSAVQAEKDVVRHAFSAAGTGAKKAGVGAGVAIVGALIALAMLLGALFVWLAELTSPLAAFLILAGVGAFIAFVGYSMLKSGSGRISEVIETVKR